MNADAFHLSNRFYKTALVDIKDIVVPFPERPHVFLIVVVGVNKDLEFGISILGGPELLNDRSAGMLSDPWRTDDKHLARFRDAIGQQLIKPIFVPIEMG